MSRARPFAVPLAAMLLAGALAGAPAQAAAPPPVPTTVATTVATTVKTTTPTAAPTDPDVRVNLEGDGVLPLARAAARIGIRRWPGDTIRYWAKVPASFGWSLKTAIRQWNRTGLDMTFVRTTRARAQLKITIGDTQGADGLATVGYQAANWVHLSKTLLDIAPQADEAYGRVVAAHIITHELGHNLGLEHTDSCHLMTPVLMLPSCPMMADRMGYYGCRIVDGQALDETLAIYGGRRKLAPAACPVDPLPAALKDVSFTGGLAAERPVTVTWQPPAHAPAGSKVLGLVAAGATCTFPTTADFYGVVGYDPRVQVVTLDPAKGTWQPPRDGVRTHCYGLRLVNRSDGGRPPAAKPMTSWVPKPAAPTVQVVRRYRDQVNFPTSYEATVDHDSSLQLAMLSAPTGHCVTTWPEGTPFSQHYVYGAPGEPLTVDAPGTNPCLSFFTVRNDAARASDAATWQVGTEPAPALPTVTSVRRVPGTDAYDLQATWDATVADLAYLVRPQGQCATSWPTGEDPNAHLYDWSALQAPGTTQPCFSFFTVNSADAPSSPAVTWQVAPAPAPPTPAISGLTLSSGHVTGQVVLDLDQFALAAVEAPQGACVSSIPAGDSPWTYQVATYPTATAGTADLETWVSSDHPCLTFFAYNADGVVGTGVPEQL